MEVFLMSIHAVVPSFRNHAGPDAGSAQTRTASTRSLQLRSKRAPAMPPPSHFPAHAAFDEATYRQAELFYLQKQIQSQTPMVVVLEDGEIVEGCIEWYDRNSIKVRGRAKTLIYKSAIKYMYKHGEQG
jgi:sRNA-binding regulator protein Hfq